jgi:hypothetical protein
VLALAAPGVASAHHSKHRHSSRHKHHGAAHIVRFGTFGTAFGPASAQTSTPTSPSGETAGTVASFTGGVLTITLKDGSTVSGKVTEQTELECQSSTPPTTNEGDDEGGGDDSSAGGGDHAQSQPVAHESSDDGDEQGDNENGAHNCTTAALVPGAVVGEAELSVSGAGAVWKKVELVH